MFPFFNKDFLKSMMEGHKELEMKAPNGAIYRFTTNAMDDKTFNTYRMKLEEAVKNKDQTLFEKTWEELTTANQLKTDIENEFQKFSSEMHNFFAETSPLFNFSIPMLNDFNEKSLLSEEQIDKQIAHYEEKIKKLQSMKGNMDNERRKLELKKKIEENKRILDEKLDEFSKNLDNEEMKKRLTDEMTQINQVIKQLESELQSLS